jgi:hypothetical protein
MEVKQVPVQREERTVGHDEDPLRNISAKRLSELTPTALIEAVFIKKIKLKELAELYELPLNVIKDLYDSVLRGAYKGDIRATKFDMSKQDIPKGSGVITNSRKAGKSYDLSS